MSADYTRIAKAINYLEENFREQPDLGELATYLNLSPYHLQRLFKRWAGISPKRFLQFLTVEYAKELLCNSSSVMDAAYDVGLSGPSRLHDLMVTIESVTPGEFKSKGAGLQIYYGIHPSPFGDCLLAITERGICALSFLDTESRKSTLDSLQAKWSQAELIEDPQRTQSTLEQIFPDKILIDANGEQKTTAKKPVRLFVQGTNFQLKVWDALLRIPAGAVSSYADIAQQIDKPKAARAVGSAVSVNPIAYLIPCHRVIRKSGEVKDYRWGATRKKAMLGWEAAQL